MKDELVYDEKWEVSTDELGKSVVLVKEGKVVCSDVRYKRFQKQPFVNLCNWLAKKFPESFDVERVK